MTQQINQNQIADFINAGGLVPYFFLLPIDEVVGYQVDRENTSISLNLQQDSDFYKVEIADLTGKYSFEAERSANGMIFRHKLEFEIPKLQAARNVFLISLIEQKLMVKIVDRNGNTFIMSSPAHHAMIDLVTGTTGGQSEKNGTKYSIAVETDSTIFVLQNP